MLNAFRYLLCSKLCQHNRRVPITRLQCQAGNNRFTITDIKNDNVNWYNNYLIKNSQAVKKGAAPKKAMVKKDVKSKVAAKKWL